MRSIVLFSIQAFLVAGLVGIPRLTAANRWDFISPELWASFLGSRLYILMGLAVLNLFASTFASIFLDPRQRRRRIRAGILSSLNNELFTKDEQEDLRITIFTRPNAFSAPFIWGRVLWGEGIRRCRGKKSELRLRLRRVLRYRFVRPLQRLGTKYPNARTHFFYNVDDGEYCEGVVGQVMQTRAATVKRNLMPPTSEELKGHYREDQAPQEIKSYMNDTNANLRTLRRLNIRAKHFYGQPIENAATSKIVGVLILDSTNNRDPFNKQRVRSTVEKYAKMLYETL